MPTPDKLMLYRQVLGTTGDVWLAVMLLVGLFLVLIFRPERVRQWGLFQIACWLLALSVMIPPVLNVLVALTESSSSPPWGSRSSLGRFNVIISCVYLVGPFLQGLGILFGLLSLIPTRPASTPQAPVKHPLE
ncbi:MAG: hypothetical protein JXB10_01910 [Pirellulales bacterium]|nr:hypothetical protein [Pirellulales bacterium]